MTLFLWKGLLLGFSVAAPVGPIGVLCIRRTLHLGPKYGFLTGMGAATADGFYGLVAGLGLVSISSALIEYQLWIRLIGGIFLLYLGWKIFRSPPSRSTTEAGEGSLLAAYVSSLFLTVTNPMTILSFAAAFAGLGLGVSPASSWVDGYSLVVGVFWGSAVWWFILSAGTGLIRHRLNDSLLLWINRISGCIILCFAAMAFLQINRS